MRALLLVMLFCLTSSLSFAATVEKVSGKKIYVKGKKKEFKKNANVYFFNKKKKKTGKGEVVKVSGSKYNVQLLGGKVKKGYWVKPAKNISKKKKRKKKKDEPFFNFKNTKRSKTVMGFIGLSPMKFGGDYRKNLKSKKRWSYRVGGLYWSQSVETISISLLEVSGGAEYKFNMSGFDLAAGGRIGFANISVKGITAEGTSDNSIVISPFVTALKEVKRKWRVGAEIRLPLYLNGSITSTKSFYILGVVDYAL